MKTIFFTISRGALIRNFFRSGVIPNLLERGKQVVILTPNYDDPELFKEWQYDNLFFEPLYKPKKKKFERIFRELYRGAIFNRTVHFLYKHKLYGKEPSKLLYYPRIIILPVLRYIPGFKKFVHWLDFKINPQTEHEYLFKKYQPDLVFSTAAGCYTESGPLKSAKRFKAKTVCMPKSWDNMSKALFNFKTDYLIVWSKFMLKQATEYQGYKKDEVIITGIPQFDYYAKKENIIPREEFCRRHNLDPKKKIIFYGSNGVNENYEFMFPEIIKEFMDTGELENVQVLVRPHLGYVGDADQFKPLAEYDNFAVDLTDKQSDKFKDHWDPSLNHLRNLFNSLYHADVSINIASTLILDSTACGTPVININFDVREIKNFCESVKRFYQTDYIRAVMASQATWLVETKEELLDALKRILSGEKKDEEKLKNFINYFMYKIDGHSAERVANNLIKIAENKLS
ncbi:MAG: CDP-glycerol glycerophosphotransferase family protein [Patescibacteria group bacterium]